MTKLEKLINHERSARKIGNVAEADAYKCKIDELRGREKAERDSQIVNESWKCSCGMNLNINIDAGGVGRFVADGMLAPHRVAGHKLEQL